MTDELCVLLSSPALCFESVRHLYLTLPNTPQHYRSQVSFLSAARGNDCSPWPAIHRPTQVLPI
ncbi:hypothetical protein E2C01_016150 [Portunus trituberculatus]|uniref:Uncharacterized protein n=1 Tax=Portunus trituberculatus TaxID=210409 RepID=A0A5B7DNC0_PORTR|nr:hypothetical protein [Portunus trituberculatus]